MRSEPLRIKIFKVIKIENNGENFGMLLNLAHEKDSINYINMIIKFIKL